MVDVQGLFEVVGRRYELVIALRGAAATKPELVETIDVSRSTVDRAVRELESAGIVERNCGEYGLTLFGSMLVEEFETFRGRVRGLGCAESLLSALPNDAPLEAEAFVDAEIVTAGRTNPHRPTDRHLELVERARQVSVIGTALSPQYVSTYRDQVVDGGMRLRAACPPDVMRRLVTEYGDQLEEMIGTGRCRLRELGDGPPFSLAVLQTPESTYLALLVYGTDGVRGYVRNDAPAAVAWARTFFEEQWADGADVTPARVREP